MDRSSSCCLFFVFYNDSGSENNLDDFTSVVSDVSVFFQLHKTIQRRRLEARHTIDIQALHCFPENSKMRLQPVPYFPESFKTDISGLSCLVDYCPDVDYYLKSATLALRCSIGSCASFKHYLHRLFVFNICWTCDWRHRTTGLGSLQRYAPSGIPIDWSCYPISPLPLHQFLTPSLQAWSTCSNAPRFPSYYRSVSRVPSTVYARVKLLVSGFSRLYKGEMPRIVGGEIVLVKWLILRTNVDRGFGKLSGQLTSSDGKSTISIPASVRFVCLFFF
jgi:hypothetical protein